MTRGNKSHDPAHLNGVIGEDKRLESGEFLNIFRQRCELIGPEVQLCECRPRAKIFGVGRGERARWWEGVKPLIPVLLTTREDLTLTQGQCGELVVSEVQGGQLGCLGKHTQRNFCDCVVFYGQRLESAAELRYRLDITVV